MTDTIRPNRSALRDRVGLVAKLSPRAIVLGAALALAMPLATPLAPLFGSEASAAVMVPPGNRSASQPAIPGASKRRTAAKKTTFERKYAGIRDLLATDAKLRGKIVKVSRLYGIDPVHVAGALVGEHTYNVDAYDRMQTYAMKAMRYLKDDIEFAHDGESVMRFVARPEFAGCNAIKASEGLWTCRENIWNNQFRGQKAGGKAWPDDRFSAVFFQPFYAGQTFGLGQINPLQALKMSDRVAKASRLPRLDAAKGGKVYAAIMDPDQSLHYVAATIRSSIDAYGRAGFDISQNPGITATLYNLGRPHARAAALASRGGMPRENYYGWLVNAKEAELRALF